MPFVVCGGQFFVYLGGVNTFCMKGSNFDVFYQILAIFVLGGEFLVIFV